MDKIQKKFRLLKKIKDPKFEIDRLEFYSLSLYLGQKDFQILITDHENNHVVLLEDYVFNTDVSEDEKYEVMKFIFDDHHLLLANFWKSIYLIIKNRNYSFVPHSLFDVSNASKYLSINSGFDTDSEEVMLTYHKFFDAVNVFSVPEKYVQLLSGIYKAKKVQFLHQSSVMINGLLTLNETDQREIAMFIDRFGLHIVVVQDKKLVFYNQYVIQKFDEYIKFIKMVSSELNFDLENDKIFLYGYLGENTPHFNELKKTLKQLNFGVRPKNLNFGYVFDELLEHQYFDIFAGQSIRT